MRVLMVEPSGWGGIALYTHALCSALVEQGVEVRLLNNAHRDDLSHLNRDYEVVPVVQGDAWGDEWKRLRQQIETWKPDVFHMQTLISSRRDVLAFLRHRLFDDQIRYVVTAHNIVPHEVAPFEETAYRWLYRLSDGVIVHSQVSQKKLNALVANLSTPVSVIHHGHYGLLFDNAAVSREEALALLGLSEGRYIVCFGAIRPYKGVEWMLQAVAAIKAWPDDLKVLIAGKVLAGTTPEALRKLAEDLDIEERIEFRLKYFDEAEIPAIFKVADAAALSYKAIDQSGVMMAALASGKAIVCTPVGAFPEVVDETVGIVSEQASLESFTGSLQSFLDQREAWESMGHAARKKADRIYNWEHAASQTLAFYRSVRGLEAVEHD